MRSAMILGLMLAGAPVMAQQAATLPARAPVTPAAASQVSPTPALPGAVTIKPVEKPGEVAKRAPVNGVLILYGNERCPTNNDGAEIVVCERRSAQEQFRVPKELREFQVTPQNQSWAARAQGVLDTGVGVSSTGSCSVVGASGQSGCFAQAARAARAERQQQKAEEARIP
ncbi:MULTISPECIES: hypothetical protein [unclassified Sphingomonas]|jgi:hypothetical protein|uniref:hypothetical protein n=1 Tax=unclassified Sphingomonas TaxID=196159 RepID=UPI000E106AE4|nr:MULTISPECIES: hypothetical protein [unclassified Sphingomonas]AXJ94854.1 hypothetical protein DM480_04375 [Sphingomonas sp. FARSPH]